MYTAQPPAPAAPAAPAAKPYGTLAQVMRGIPFPNSNIIFDTQSTDPAAAQKPPEAGAPATQTFAGVYGGWQAVENASIALQETGNLLLVPGRMCENGRPAPIDQEDFKKWAQGLVDAGAACLQGRPVEEHGPDGRGQRNRRRCVRGLSREVS